MADPSNAPLLVAEDLHKAFGARAVLDGVTLSIHAGERIGIVGLNGSGKSTLVRILSGVDAADRGTVARRRDARIAILEQDPELPPDATALDVVLGGLGAWTAAKARYDEAAAALAHGVGDPAALTALADAVEHAGGWDPSHRARKILDHLGISATDARVSTLSGGERRRVALARILVAAPDLAILDEPSNHLDVDTVAWLERYLSEEHEGAVLLITHDRYLLDRVATRTWEIDEGALHVFEGGYEEYLEQKTERLALAARAEQNRQNFLRKELEWLRRQPKARTGKQKARIQRAETAKAVQAPREGRKLELGGDSVRLGKTVLELGGARVELAGRPLVAGLDLIVSPGDRIGVVGRNGTGKTTLLRAIAGELELAAGSRTVGLNTKIAYFDQHREQLDDALSVFDQVGGEKGRVRVGERVLDVRQYMERFGFSPERQRQPVGSLSGGERARVALAKLLAEPHNLLLLDEPTNDLDVMTLAALEELLVDSGGAAVVVTHDRWFLNRVATAILSFEGDGRVVRYAGGYDDYVTQRDAARAEAAAAATAAPAAAKAAEARPAERKASRGLTYAERLELERLPGLIEEGEATIGALEAELADPTLYAKRGHEVPALQARLESARGEVAARYARWEALEGKAG